MIDAMVGEVFVLAVERGEADAAGNDNYYPTRVFCNPLEVTRDNHRSAARYEARVGDNHHHLVCRSCGAIVDVDCAVGEAPCLAPAEDAGYDVDEAEVIYWGRCPECVEKKGTT